MTSTDPRSLHHEGGFPKQEQEQPGTLDETVPTPDHGEESYRGSGRLDGRRALITGGDSGIGRAVAIAFAREGADVAISYLADEQDDAEETAGIIEDAGRTAVLLPGDLRDATWCDALVQHAVDALGGLDALVLNAGTQHSRGGIEGIERDSMLEVLETNLVAPTLIAKAAVPHLEAGSTIVITTSVQAYEPSPDLLDYAMTKAGGVILTKCLAEELGPRGIRVNAVAPGPIWTPLIPATGWGERLEGFGQDTPLGRAGQPAELASAYVHLTSAESSYTAGAIVAVTGGRRLA